MAMTTNTVEQVRLTNNLSNYNMVMGRYINKIRKTIAQSYVNSYLIVPFTSYLSQKHFKNIFIYNRCNYKKIPLYIIS